MKKKINSKKVACFLTALMMLVGFLIGGGRSLGSLRSTSEAEFYGIGGLISIEEEIHDYQRFTANLITVALRQYDVNQPQIMSVHSANNFVTAALDERRLDAGKVYAAYYELRRAVGDLEQLLNRSDIPNNAFSDIIDELGRRNVRLMNQRTVFNNSAMSFNTTLNKIPAVFFRITGIVRPIILFD